MDTKDIVVSVMRSSDIPTLIILRQVCHLYYQLTDTLVTHTYSFKQCFWNTVFIHNAQSSYSALYRNKRESLSLAISNNDLEYVDQEINTHEYHVKSEASRLGRYNLLEKLIPDPLCLFFAKLGSALTNADIPMIESLYENISEEELSLIRCNKSVIVTHLRLCSDYRVVFSAITNFPYVLPLITVSKERRLDIFNRWGATLLVNALHADKLDDADFIFSLMMKPNITLWLAIVLGVRSISALKWVLDNASVTHLDAILEVCLVRSITDFNFELIEHIITLNCDIKWCSILQELSKLPVAHTHLLLKYVPQEMIVTEPLVILATPSVVPVNNVPCIYFPDKERQSSKTYYPTNKETISYDDIVRMALRSKSSQLLDYAINYCSRHTTIDWEYLKTYDGELPIEMFQCLSTLYERYNEGKRLYSYDSEFL